VTKNRSMHLFGFSLWSPSAHMMGAWRHPASHGPGLDWSGPELWQQIATDCERGRMDGFFFAVSLAPYGVYKNSIAPTLRNGIQSPTLDTMLLLPMMAAVTKRLGLVSTLSTAFNHPFSAVRQFATLTIWLRAESAGTSSLLSILFRSRTQKLDASLMCDRREPRRYGRKLNDGSAQYSFPAPDAGESAARLSLLHGAPRRANSI
jgi:hypothetical protein